MVSPCAHHSPSSSFLFERTSIDLAAVAQSISQDSSPPPPQYYSRFGIVSQIPGPGSSTVWPSGMSGPAELRGKPLREWCWGAQMQSERHRLGCTFGLATGLMREYSITRSPPMGYQGCAHAWARFDILPTMVGGGCLKVATSSVADDVCAALAPLGHHDDDPSELAREQRLHWLACIAASAYQIAMDPWTVTRTPKDIHHHCGLLVGVGTETALHHLRSRVRVEAASLCERMAGARIAKGATWQSLDIFNLTVLGEY